MSSGASPARRSASGSAGEYFGELYLRSTRCFLDAAATAAEARFIGTALGAAASSGPVLDLGCGHGRHLAALRRELSSTQLQASCAPLLVGVDLDLGSLTEALAEAPVVRADFRRLPFRDEAFAGAYCWYNSLGTLEDRDIVRALAEARRCLAPGGLFLLQSTHALPVRGKPTAHFEGRLPDGSWLVEEASFDPGRDRDELQRILTLPDGRVLRGAVSVRYFALDALTHFLAEAGLETVRTWGGENGAVLAPSSVDLIVGATRRE